MQSKQIAVGGILAGAVVAGLGVVVLLGSLAEAEQPDQEPVTGFEDVGTGYSEVEPLPRSRASTPTEKPSAESSEGASPEAVSEPEPEAYVSREPGTEPTGAPDSPSAPPASAEPTKPGGSEPTSRPTRTTEPEPTEEPSPSDPTTEPEPTETPTPAPDPHEVIEID
ncbi:hypothetical protein FB381_2017 [Nocardioides albertanoniae]|uniref:Uncharacterized protein n=1 Tax=Nocardioides albertanoniae TaxID=1175486 RepID=A0A543A6C8_9ACTN|nr:hypothetical protein [Nocardioides albertanoniae]TQL68128.1 hypothetical protein FB381_2017 [Nocardioides albertanoniae]